MRRLVLGLWAAAVVLVPTSASAVPPAETQGFYLPLDVSSGVAFGRGEPRPYALRVRLTPSLGLGKTDGVRVGVQVATIYENPVWLGGIGGAASVRIWSIPLKEVGLFLTADHLWRQGRRPSSGLALILDLDGMCRAGLRLDRDWREESSIIQGTVGADLPTLAHVLCGRRKTGVKLPRDDE